MNDDLVQRIIDYVDKVAGYKEEERQDLLHELQEVAGRKVSYGSGERVHELKTWAPYFEQIITGAKTFDIRKFDRDYRVGDLLLLKEYSTKFGYSGREFMVRIRYILYEDGGNFGLQPNFGILGISRAGSHMQVKLRAHGYSDEDYKGTSTAHLKDWKDARWILERIHYSVELEIDHESFVADAANLILWKSVIPLEDYQNFEIVPV